MSLKPLFSFLSPLPVKQMKPKSQQGSSLVIAIFIIIVLALLGGALVKMLTATSESIVYEVYGTRAYLAAHSGLQIKLAEVFPLGGAAAECDGIEDSYSFTNVTGLAVCNVDAVCNSADYTVDSETTTIYTVNSVSECSVDDIVTSRKLEITAQDISL